MLLAACLASFELIESLRHEFIYKYSIRKKIGGSIINFLNQVELTRRCVACTYSLRACKSRRNYAAR